MKDVTQDDAPPVCQKCKRNRVAQKRITPFAKTIGGDAPDIVKNSKYCTSCAELVFTDRKSKNQQATIARRIASAEKSGAIPFFGTHDPAKWDKVTMQAFGEAAFEGSKKDGTLQLKPTGVYCWGKTGKCKSRAASRASEAVIALGYTLAWISYADALRGNVEAVMSDPPRNRQYMEDLQKPTVLVLDDFGKGRLTETGIEFLFKLIDTRYMAMGSRLCPIWITAQDKLENIVNKKHLPTSCAHYSEALVRRVKEITTEVKT